MNKIKLGILGYGNLGKRVEIGVKQNPDIELIGIFTRRDPNTIKTVTGVPAYTLADLDSFKEKIDVLALCVGSAIDLPEVGPKYLKYFNTVDTYDNHDEIPAYLEKLEKIGNEYNKLAIVATGWDPGLFTKQKVLVESIIKTGIVDTFYGPGKSLGHSNAINAIDGVVDAVQITNSNKELIEAIKAGEATEYSAFDKHKRECYVVAKEGADQNLIKAEIINMKGYFVGYETIVKFVTLDELKKNHDTDSHQGLVLGVGEMADGTRTVIELKVAFESNASSTASIMLSNVRAAYRLAQEGKTGAVSVLDVPVGYLHHKSQAKQRKYI